MKSYAVSIDDIRAAASALEGVVIRTPLLENPDVNALLGGRLLLKAENLQRTGAFKIRGAYHRMLGLTAEERGRGAVTYSSGNHALGLARAAQVLGSSAVIVMPSDAPAIKIANTRALGAEVVLYDRSSEDRDAIGAALAAERGLTLIKPFDEPQVIAGQGTCGLEIAEQAAEAGATGAEIYVCCGGGGFTSGIALATEGAHRVRPVEPEGFDDVTRSLASGSIERNAQTSGGLCDAIITPQPGEITFPIMQRLCGPGIVVTEEEALRAMAHAFLRLKLVLEPGGAVALAAALFHPGEGDVICTASGGNVDAQVFQRALETL